MKTVKTTLIVVGTLVAVYFAFDFITGVYFYYQDSVAESEALESGLNLNSVLTDLGETYKGKTVTINSWDPASMEYLEVPLWQIYKYNKVGTLLNGDKVILLNVELYDSKGRCAKVRTADGYEGYITYWYIKEFSKAADIDPLLNL
ncbi:SH3 domain-containing protein [Pontibacter sp. 172403-2]|uniref:SH3 domain-containing protein n=1 Tax=Pontibacter rufus TaxID=2791028 RepID=UPI0018AF54C2|nr:SH3 domain-containing protein [Pontibacter sp. 172403-2]MBF9252444.1 SH3 domain-containing protein [Pontibacter sp. 172403-2]